MRELVKQGKKFYANKYLRHQWIRKTLWLKSAGKHATQTGGFLRWTA